MNITEIVAAICLILATGCTQRTPVEHADRETCYAKARLNFHEATESCQTEQCIDDLAEDYKREQEACP